VRISRSTVRFDSGADPELGRILVDLTSGDAQHEGNRVIWAVVRSSPFNARKTVSDCHASRLLPSGKGWLRAIRTASTAALRSVSG
jgi:hypothetical protein